MINVKNANTEIRCFNLTSSNKIIKTTLQNIENQKDKSLSLIEMNFFGISQVYSLMDISKVNKVIRNISEEGIAEKLMLSITRVIEDSPIVNGVNLKTRGIYLTELSVADWISIYQLYYLMQGMNSMSDSDIEYDLQIGKEIDIPIVDLSELKFSSNVEYKYISRFKDGTYRFSNSIDTYDFEGIFINIPEFNCWQYLSKKKFDIVNYPENIEIKYAITDSPRCFSRVSYFHSYSFDNIESLLIHCISIPIDIYFRKYFEDSNYSLSSKTYDALEIIIDGDKYSTSVLLTHEELGIDSFNNRNIIFMDKFCLLKLINNIICLKPY